MRYDKAIAEIKAKIAPVDQDAHDMAKIYVEQGKQECITQLRVLIIKKKLTVCEKFILCDKIRSILTNNGVRL